MNNFHNILFAFGVFCSMINLTQNAEKKINNLFSVGRYFLWKIENLHKTTFRGGNFVEFYVFKLSTYTDLNWYHNRVT